MSQPIAAIYPYKILNGETIYEIVRLENKQFFQRIPNGDGSYRHSLEDIERIPYRLPELRCGIQNGETIFLVEGEKDADRLNQLGLCATTNAGGANWPFSDSFASCFSGALRIIVLPDCDVIGRKAAHDRASILTQQCTDVRILDLAKDRNDHFDVSDWLDEGNTADTLKKMALKCPLFRPFESEKRNKNSLSQQKYQAVFVDWSKVLIEEIEFLFDGIPRNELSILEGLGGIGKSLILSDWAARLSRDGMMPCGTKNPVGRTMIIGIEDGNSIWKRRLIAADANLNYIQLLDSISSPKGPRGFILPDDLPIIEKAIIGHNSSLLIIDGLFSHFRHDLNANNSQEVRRALAPLVDLAHRLNITVIVIRHLRKGASSAAERGLGSVDIRNIARSVMTVGIDPTDSQMRVIAPSKSNLKGIKAAQRFSIADHKITGDDGKPVSVGRLLWHGTCEIIADDITMSTASTAEERSALNEAKETIIAALSEGPLNAQQLVNRLRCEGIADRTAERARGELSKGSVIKRSGGGKASPIMWSLITDRQTFNRSPKNKIGDLPEKLAINTSTLFTQKEDAYLI